MYLALPLKGPSSRSRSISSSPSASGSAASSTTTAITLALFYAHIISVYARSALYGPCNATNNHLDADSKVFVTDCDSFGFCSINGTCLPRQCRRDEYPLSSLLDSTVPVPPQCPQGTFCPDDASGCLALVDVGGQCQLNRDDECAPPPDGQVLVIPSPFDEPDGNGVLCLLGQCTYANVALGATCITESTTYTGYDSSGMSFTSVVVRDNCIEGQGYCDVTSNTCFPLLSLEEACEEDRQCQSYNCDREKCVPPPGSAVKVAKWVYGVTGLSVFLGMAGILSILLLMHRRSQNSKRIMLEDYYREQTAYRNSILSFHSALSSRSKSKEDPRRAISTNMSQATLVESVPASASASATDMDMDRKRGH
ncbi:hypothetical protein IAU59_006728 [Kwoniella sp. CBS 9459]